MQKGQKLWKKATKIIPGGNMLLSKRSEMFLPNLWPAYFSKSKGCTVWDLDKNAYTDMCIMGIGTNTLGYGHPDVNDAVIKAINDGNMSTFNCPEEVELAEKLIDMHEFAEMARFARSGGEANAIAIRIARAASGKDRVAFCGYHGWHDWYLAANLTDNKKLEPHLLPGLNPEGVPQHLAGSIFPFNYNQFDELLDLVNEQDIGVIKMEVSRNLGPNDDFLQKVRKLATERNIVLVFDECTSGFRETYGGIHKKYQVEPDIAVFGKAMGNGHAITAIIGRRNVMESAQSTFISSTFWTERSGSVAALKTLEVMENIGSWNVITEQGTKIKKGWQELATNNKVEINISGLAPIASFGFNSKNSLAYKTLITQEMLKKGFLASNLIYVCIDHTDKIIKDYLQALEPIFSKIALCEADNINVLSLLDNDICHGSFKRLN